MENRLDDSDGGNFMQDVTNWRDAGLTGIDQDGGMQVSWHRHSKIDNLCLHISSGGGIFILPGKLTEHIFIHSKDLRNSYKGEEGEWMNHL